MSAFALPVRPPNKVLRLSNILVKFVFDNKSTIVARLFQSVMMIEIYKTSIWCHFLYYITTISLS